MFAEESKAIEAIAKTVNRNTHTISNIAKKIEIGTPFQHLGKREKEMQSLKT